MDELLGDFLTETKESIDVLDNQLVTFEQNPNNKDLLNSIFRIMHTIKGTCGFLGLPRLESVAHAGENIMDKIRNNEIPPTSHNVSMIIEAIDKIKELVAYLEQNSSEPSGDDKDLIERLNKSAAGQVVGKEIKEENIVPDTPIVENNIKQEEAIIPKSDVLVMNEVAKKEAINKGLEIANQVKDESHHAVSGQNTIRVNVDVLENLMQIVSELVLNRNQLLQIDRSVKDNKFTSSIQRLSNITTELQDSVMKTRMQPIKNAWTKFPRLVRDLSIELGKKVELVMIGEETELDRQLIETIKDPLTHMVRNSVDHGLEMPDDRIKNGKNETGTVTLKAFHQGGYIIIEISDDGKGLNIERIKTKIIENKLASEEVVNSMTDQQAMQYIFKAGFSTADKVTAISGRGVGMDVVKTNIEKISGAVELASILNKGSRFTIKIPLTLAIMPILIIESGTEKFGIPQISVVEMVRTGRSSEYIIEEIHGKRILRLRNNLLPLMTLSEVLNINNNTIKQDIQNIDLKESLYIVVCEVNNHHFGIVVDKIYDTEEIVVKPVAPVLKKIGMYSGNTILGDGQVIMIIDPAGLIKFINEINDSSAVEMNLLSHIDKKVSKGLLSSFLVIRDVDDTEKTIPLELIARLEEVDIKKIEYSNGKRVIQYRDGLMYLEALSPDFALPSEGMLDVVVFLNKEKTLGLVVKEILDIVEQDVDSNKVLEDSDFNAIIINNKTMDVININDCFERVFSEEENGANLVSKNKHILLVDDSPFFRKFIPPSIIEAGYLVSTVENAVRAIEMLEEGKEYDLIITDINMPEMSGSEFVTYCKNNAKLKDIPIIALTSSNDEFKRDQIVSEYGFLACISKTNHEDLLGIVADILKKYKGNV